MYHITTLTEYLISCLRSVSMSFKIRFYKIHFVLQKQSTNLGHRVFVLLETLKERNIGCGTTVV